MGVLVWGLLVVVEMVVLLGMEVNRPSGGGGSRAFRGGLKGGSCGASGGGGVGGRSRSCGPGDQGGCKIRAFCNSHIGCLNN